MSSCYQRSASGSRVLLESGQIADVNSRYDTALARRMLEVLGYTLLCIQELLRKVEESSSASLDQGAIPNEVFDGLKLVTYTSARSR